MSRRWAGIGLALALAAQAGSGAETVPAPRIDAAASKAAIDIDLRLGGHVIGRFRAFEGWLQREDDGRLRVSVSLDARGLDLEGPDWMQRSMRSDKFLDVQRHPRIRFLSDPFDPAVVRAGGALSGELELRGQRRQVRFRVDPADCGRPGYDCDIHVSGDVSRRAFGMSAYRVWVHDAVGFDFRVRLRDPERP